MGASSSTGGLHGFHENSLIFMSRFWTFYCMYPKRMTTTPQIPASAQGLQPSSSAAEVETPATEQALVPVSGDAHNSAEEAPEVTGPVALLPIEVDVSVPVRNFRVHHLLALDREQVIETQWHSGEDVPLAAGNVQLAWSEFEVIESELAVRITRLT
jgi:flagellar motor switch protein FliN/FliY